jgi:hypothetical protein
LWNWQTSLLFRVFPKSGALQKIPAPGSIQTNV